MVPNRRSVDRKTPLATLTIAVTLWVACSPDSADEDDTPPHTDQDSDITSDTDHPHSDVVEYFPHDAIAEGIQGELGGPLPLATAEMLAAFERGRALFTKEFTVADGAGPYIETQSCVACHERPTVGGDAGLYRNGLIAGVADGDGYRLADGTEVPRGVMDGGIVRQYHVGPNGLAAGYVPDIVTRFAAMNPLPLYGVGLFSLVSDDEILSRADPDDADGDGISGRAATRLGEVGRNGVKGENPGVQENTRFNLMHLMGITLYSPTPEELSRLPLPDRGHDLPLEPDDDDVPDPELAMEDFLDLMAFVQLLAIPVFDPMTAAEVEGRAMFAEIGCAACHTPRLESDIGPIPAYSDLLLHDMGSLGNDISIGAADMVITGSEFRTQPLWGVAATGPYLHDGRASTLHEAILAHDGEAEAARDLFLAEDPADQRKLEDFLRTLGGREFESRGSRLVPNQPLPSAGELGAHDGSVDDTEFALDRAAFDRMYGITDGVGSPGFNGDSCTSCHIQRAPGGAGGVDTNVVRQGAVTPDGDYRALGTDSVPKHFQVTKDPHGPDADATILEHRQTTALFGLGLVEQVLESAIVAGADPTDSDLDGIRGRVPRLADGTLGRFGWKASTSGLDDFTCDALSVEMGLTTSEDACGTAGRRTDADAAPDPEVPDETVARMTEFVRALAPPPQRPATAASERGEALFQQLHCDACHTPSMPTPAGDIPVYSDLLLHSVAGTLKRGIEEGAAQMDEYRTPPLWGLRDSAPYMHTGEAVTYRDVIELHAGEAAASRSAYRLLPSADRADLAAFLNTL